MKLIFLDIDGVLNDHTPYDNGYCGIDDKKVRLLSSLINRTNAQLVISSAWRYMILGGVMDKVGFLYMLKAHGLTNEAVVHGCTCSDEVVPDRDTQITEYNYLAQPEKYVVLDDLDFIKSHPFVKVDGNRGLSHEDVEKAVDILT